MDCSLPDSSVHGIFQEIVLEWIAIYFSKGPSQPKDRTWVFHIIDRRFTIWATREVPPCMGNYKNLDSLKSSFWYEPQPSKASILFIPEFPRGAPLGEAVVAKGFAVNRLLFFSILNSLEGSLLGWLAVAPWWMQYSLFIDMSDNIFHSQDLESEFTKVKWPWNLGAPNHLTKAIEVLPELMGFLGGTSCKEPACQCRRFKRCGFEP